MPLVDPTQAAVPGQEDPQNLYLQQTLQRLGLTDPSYGPAEASRLPIPQSILMTAAHNDQTVFQAMDLGAFAYVIKPLGDEDVVSDLRHVLDEALEISRRPRPVPIPRPSGQPDEDQLVARVGQEPEPFLGVAEPCRRNVDVDRGHRPRP